MEAIIEKRKQITEQYNTLLNSFVSCPQIPEEVQYNYSYYPVIFSSEEKLLKAVEALKKHEIYGRRYFSPSLNTLPFIEYQNCPVSEDISKRVLCLPLYFELTSQEIKKISGCIISIQ